jgi:hypothetical protein
MAKTPLSEMERVGRKVSKILTDIATKMDSIKMAEQIQPFQVPEFDELDKKLAEQMTRIETLKKGWKSYGENMEKVVKKIIEVEKIRDKALERSADIQEELMELAEKKGKLDEDDKRRQRTLIKMQKEANDEAEKAVEWLKLNNKEKLRAAAFNQAFKKSMAGFLDKAATKYIQIGIATLVAGFETLGSSVRNIYDMTNRFKAAQAGMAEAIGVTTSNLGMLQTTAFETYMSRSGLGSLGMSLEQITQSFGALSAATQYHDALATQDYVTAVKLAKVFGLTDEELGNLLRSNRYLNVSLADQEEEFRLVAGAARKFGMNAKQLQKDVFVLGKNLLDMAGPVWRKQMEDAIVSIRKMGISVGTMEKFTDMTDVFDRTVESVARMNTAFGLHINALKLFDEQDPAKRFQQINDQLRIQGKSVETMTRQQKKLMAETLGLTMEETNAMLKYAQAGKDVSEAMKASEKETASLDSFMQGLRTTMANVVQIMDRIYVSVGKALAPAFAAVGISITDSKGEMKGFGDVIGQIGDKFLKFIDAVAKSPEFATAMKRIGDSVQKFFTFLDDPQTAGKFVKFMTDVAEAMAKWSERIEWAIEVGSKFLSVLGFIVKTFEYVLGIKAFMWVVTKLRAVSAAAEGAGTAAHGFTTVLKNVASVAKSVWGSVSNVVMEFGNAASNIASRVGSVFSNTWSIIKSGADVVANVVSKVFGFVKSMIDGAMGWIQKGLSIASRIAGFFGSSMGEIGAMGAGGMAAAGAAVVGAGVGGYQIGSAMERNNTFGVNDIAQKGLEMVFGTPEQAYANNSLVARAEGGPVSAGVPYMVGEKGIEKFTPKTDGYITPNNQLGGQSGPIIVQVILDGEVIQDKMYKANLRSG